MSVNVQAIIDAYEFKKKVVEQKFWSAVNELEALGCPSYDVAETALEIVDYIFEAVILPRLKEDQHNEKGAAELLTEMSLAHYHVISAVKAMALSD